MKLGRVRSGAAARRAKSAGDAVCRLLGIVTAAPYDFGLLLREAPRSLAALSQEHRDGWGLATHPGAPGEAWSLSRSARTAAEDPAFAELTRRAHGRVLIAHVRKKTRGDLKIENTHPFLRGTWVFAHNGTIEDTAFVRSRASRERLAERDGETDSELFFALLLTRLDEVGLTDEPVSRRTDDAVRAAVLEATSRCGFGSLNFLLSNGLSSYVGRFGRALHLLERVPTEVCDPEPAADDSEVPIARRHCIVVASEPLTAEAWTPMAQGTLLRLDLAPAPHWASIT